MTRPPPGAAVRAGAHVGAGWRGQASGHWRVGACPSPRRSHPASRNARSRHPPPSKRASFASGSGGRTWSRRSRRAGSGLDRTRPGDAVRRLRAADAGASRLRGSDGRPDLGTSAAVGDRTGSAPARRRHGRRARAARGGHRGYANATEGRDAYRERLANRGADRGMDRSRLDALGRPAGRCRRPPARPSRTVCDPRRDRPGAGAGSRPTRRRQAAPRARLDARERVLGARDPDPPGPRPRRCRERRT